MKRMYDSTPYYSKKKKELKDGAIIDDLVAAKEMYENGEILECADTLRLIVASIDAFADENGV